MFIYGAGIRGRRCLKWIRENGGQIKAFIDVDEKKAGMIIDGVPVWPMDMLRREDASGICVSPKSGAEDIKKRLQEINSGTVFFDYDRIEQAIIEKRISNYIDNVSYSKDLDNRFFSVLYDYQIFSLQLRGGISRYYYETVRRIGNIDGFSADFFSGVNSNVFIHKWNEKDVHDHFGVPVADPMEHVLFPKINRVLIREYVQGRIYDIYHPTYYDLPLERTSYRKLIITVYDMIHELFRMDEETIRNKEQIIKEADGIITISESTKRDLIRLLHVEDDKVKVIGLANSLHEKPSDVSPVVGSYVLFVGNRGFYKNYSVLVEAFSKSSELHDYKLVFFGGGEFNADEQKKFIELGVADRVVHLEGDDQQLADCYANADVFVYPSRYEGFGLPILEAMHYGTPVIAANNSSLPEVGGEACIYFDAESAEELQCQIERVLSDGNLRAHLSEAGKAREKLFSWERTAKETAKFYRYILDR